jgi:hypothetical protein
MIATAIPIATVSALKPTTSKSERSEIGFPNTHRNRRSMAWIPRLSGLRLRGTENSTRSGATLR